MRVIRVTGFLVLMIISSFLVIGFLVLPVNPDSPPATSTTTTLPVQNFDITSSGGNEFWSGRQETRYWKLRPNMVCEFDVLLNDTVCVEKPRASVVDKFTEIRIIYNKNHTLFCIIASVKPDMKEAVEKCNSHHETKHECVKNLARGEGVNVSKYDWTKVDLKKVPLKFDGFEGLYNISIDTEINLWDDYYRCFRMPDQDGEELSIGFGTEYWDSVSDCDVNGTTSKSDTTVVFTCNLKINGNLTDDNVTFQWNATSDNQYSIEVNDGGVWQSKDATFNDYGGSGYDLWIEVNSGGWVNLSSVENCETDLDGIRVYDGATFYVDDYYGNSRCRYGYWWLYAQSNSTMKDCFKDQIRLTIDSDESPVIYRFLKTGIGNMTTGNNVVKWINCSGYYQNIYGESGATGTMNITESSYDRTYAYTSQRVNLVDSSSTGYNYFYDGGGTGEAQLDNSTLTSTLCFRDTNIWTVGTTYSSLYLYKVYSGVTVDLKGYLNLPDYLVSSTFGGSINRTYPICLYMDSYSTPVSNNCNISLWNINDSVTEGNALTSSGCVNISVINLTENDEFDILEVRAESIGYRNITVFQDSIETVSGSLVGFKIANVSACAADTTEPSISAEAINDTEIEVEIEVNQSIKLNCTVSDDTAVDIVKFYIEPFGNLTATDADPEFYIICNASNPCNTTVEGQYNWTWVWANDTTNNINSTVVTLNYTVVTTTSTTTTTLPVALYVDRVGSIWEPVYAVDADGPIPVTPRQLCRTDDDQLWSIWINYTVGGYAKISSSSDNGTTWSMYTTTAGAPPDNIGIDCDKGTITASYSSGKVCHIATSYDYGATWVYNTINGAFGGASTYSDAQTDVWVKNNRTYLLTMNATGEALIHYDAEHGGQSIDSMYYLDMGEDTEDGGSGFSSADTTRMVVLWSEDTGDENDTILVIVLNDSGDMLQWKSTDNATSFGSKVKLYTDPTIDMSDNFWCNGFNQTVFCTGTDYYTGSLGDYCLYRSTDKGETWGAEDCHAPSWNKIGCLDSSNAFEKDTGDIFFVGACYNSSAFGQLIAVKWNGTWQTQINLSDIFPGTSGLNRYYMPHAARYLDSHNHLEFIVSDDDDKNLTYMSKELGVTLTTTTTISAIIISQEISLVSNVSRTLAGERKSTETLNIPSQALKIFAITRIYGQPIILPHQIDRLSTGIRELHQTSIFITFTERLFTGIRTTDQPLTLDTFTERIFSGIRSISQPFSAIFTAISEKIIVTTISITQPFSILHQAITTLAGERNPTQSLTLTSFTERLFTGIRTTDQPLTLDTFTERIFSGIRSISQPFSAIFTAISEKIIVTTISITQPFSILHQAITTLAGERNPTQSLTLTSFTERLFTGIRTTDQLLPLPHQALRELTVIRTTDQLFSLPHQITAQKIVVVIVRSITQILTIDTFTERIFSGIREPTQTLTITTSIDRILTATRSIFQQILFILGITSEKFYPPQIKWVELNVTNLADSREIQLRMNVTDTNNDLSYVTFGVYTTSSAAGIITLNISDGLSQAGSVQAVDGLGLTDDYAINFSLTDNGYEQVYTTDDLDSQNLKVNDTLKNLHSTNHLNYTIRHTIYSASVIQGQNFTGNLSSGSNVSMYTEIQKDFLTNISGWDQNHSDVQWAYNQSLIRYLNITAEVNTIWNVSTGNATLPSGYTNCVYCENHTVSWNGTIHYNQREWYHYGDAVDEEFIQDITDIEIGERTEYWVEWTYENETALDLRNISANITINAENETSWGDFIRIYNGSAWINLTARINVSIEEDDCDSIYPTLYCHNISVSGEEYRFCGCSKDIDGDDKPDYFRVVIPRFRSSKWEIRVGGFLGARPVIEEVPTHGRYCSEEELGDTYGQGEDELTCWRNQWRYCEQGECEREVRKGTVAFYGVVRNIFLLILFFVILVYVLSAAEPVQELFKEQVGEEKSEEIIGGMKRYSPMIALACVLTLGTILIISPGTILSIPSGIPPIGAVVAEMNNLFTNPWVLVLFGLVILIIFIIVYNMPRGTAKEGSEN